MSEAKVGQNNQMDGVEMDNGNFEHNEVGEDDLDGYKRINDMTDDDVRGMEFETESKAIVFYELFAKCHGLAVKKDDIEHDFNGNIVVRQLVCSKEGKSNKNSKDKVDRRIDPRPTFQTDYRARFRVAYNFVARKWKISAFEPSHNHELTPARFVHLIPKYRGLSEGDKALVNGLHTYGVRTCHILGFLMSQKGGHRGLGSIKKDLYKYVGHEGWAKVAYGDAYVALCYLQAKADNDTNFFSEFALTDEGRLDNLFWTDLVSRLDYDCFGDVVALDITYKKNRYRKPLVIFCGYNHHGETTIFGCALISDEKSETYKWVLNTFCEATYGKHPKALVTDGDNAMREAIRAVFPNSVHRLYSWHLHQNACENVKNPKFLEDFQSLMYANYTPGRFETEWKRVVDTYGVSNNKWIRKVYGMKTMWV